MTSIATSILNYKKEIKVLLLYPPAQSWPDTMCKPNGSLAYPMLAGALMEKGIEVEIYDACVGNDEDDLEDVFYNSTKLPSGLLRTGVSEERILEKVRDFDVVGFTSIFSSQETILLSTAKLIKKAFSEKLLVAGGVNARYRMEQFFESGIELICTSEAEKTILSIAEVLQKNSRDFSKIPGVAFQANGKIIVNNTNDIIWDLDQLPMPAWHLLPNERYWKIGRPHGGHFRPDEELRYASMMTSLGCPFHCSYCHIASETVNSVAGPIGRFRIKSEERVLAELNILKNLGVKQIFIEDDSLFGKKRRGIKVLQKIKGLGLDILDVNGVNIVHLFKGSEPDREVIEALIDAGFTEISLPFESGTARMIKKYGSNKWDINKLNIKALLHMCQEYGLRTEGNYMLGYPDETREEICSTLESAKWHMAEGLSAACFMLVMPLPGTPLFDMALKEGYLPKDYDIDKMHWGKANMQNTLVPGDELEEIRTTAWEEINYSEHVNYKQEMRVS